jgi:hypothetical protein
VSFADPQDLLGRNSNRNMTNYSAPELQSLIAAAEKVCDDVSYKSPTTT